MDVKKKKTTSLHKTAKNSTNCKVIQAGVLCAEAQIMINISHESIMRKNLAAE